MPPASPTIDYAATRYVITDGDTLRLDLTKVIDMGFGIRQTLVQDARLRLAGLDCKPVKTPKGDAAITWLNHETINATRPLYVVTVKNTLGVEKHEKFGRYLAFLHLVDPVTGAIVAPSLNEQMIAAGVAVEWDGRGAKPD
jgi:endonuclease YncB( thermonuclease family)